jgi:DNA-binding PadR family transcriptional regulator
MEKEGLIVSGGDGFERDLSRRRYSITKWGETYLEYLANALVEYGEEIGIFFRLFDKQLASELRLEQDDLQRGRETRNDAKARY